MKSGNKSAPNTDNVDAFIGSLTDDEQRNDSQTLIDLFGRVTNKPPVMWGNAMVGFGTLNLSYASGREVEWFNVGFSPRKGKLSLYVTFDAEELTKRFPKLGKYKIGKGCIYITQLKDVDMSQLEQLIKVAYKSGWQDPNRSDGKEQTAIL